MSDQRCWWCGDDPLSNAYHDHEWGFPVSDDRRLFEKLVLEGFPSGPSWLTILRKRKHFRRAFAGFEIKAVARFGTAYVARLLGNAGIVRHRGKIEAAIANARAALRLIKVRGSLTALVWRFELPHDRPVRRTREALAALSSTEHSGALSKKLKRTGFDFFGRTTIYAVMQAMELVNDDVEGCAAGAAARRARAAFVVPRSSYAPA
jgi:DNA-3-methyladenine glycosylase I